MATKIHVLPEWLTDRELLAKNIYYTTAVDTEDATWDSLSPYGKDPFLRIADAIIRALADGERL